MASVIAILLTSTVALYFYAAHQEDAREECYFKEKVASDIAKRDIEQYKEQIKTHDNDILAITKFYDEEIIELNNFKKDDNETECDASYRVLRDFKY